MLSIGQRVRVKWVLYPENRHLVGREGVITEVDPGAVTVFGLNFQSLVVDADGFLRGFSADQLDPILPDGHRPAEVDVHELLPFLRELVPCA